MSEKRNVLMLISVAGLFLLAILVYAVIVSGNKIDGSSWTLDRFVVDGDEVAVIEGTTLSISFDDGTVQGNGGCNNFFGAYESDGDSMSMGDLGSTRRFCNDPAGTSDQETAYFTQLGGTSGFRIEGGKLILSDDSTDLLVFGPA